MSRQEKRRKFNEAVLNTLFPPPAPAQLPKDHHGDAPASVLSEGFDADDLFLDDELGKIGSSTTTDGDDDGGGDGDDSIGGSQKLTRAQRKRLRRKKLKEDASRRSKIIGPLLPATTNHDRDDSSVAGRKPENDPPSVRRNAPEETHDIPGESSNSANQSAKLKQRRMAKRLAKESLNEPVI